MRDYSKSFRIILLISCAIISLIVGFLVSIIICVNNVYALEPYFTNSDFNISKINGYNVTTNYGVVDLYTNYGDNGNLNCIGNDCTKYYNTYTNRVLTPGVYTIEYKWWFDYDSPPNLGLFQNDLQCKYGSNINNITSNCTFDSLSFVSIESGAGGLWGIHQYYSIIATLEVTGNYYINLKIGNSSLERTSFWITDLAIYNGDNSDAIIEGLYDIIVNQNQNTQTLINNNNSNTQNVINNNNSNAQSIINNQNSNAQATQQTINQNFNDCGYNILNRDYWEIGGIASATGLDTSSTHRLRTKYVTLDTTNTYQLTSDLPYSIYYLFYYDSSYNHLSTKYIRNGSTSEILVPPNNTKYLRIVIAKFVNGEVDNSYVFNKLDILNLNTKLWSDSVCQNRVDVVNDSINNLNNSVNNVNNSINDSSVNNPSSSLTDLNSQIGTYNSVSSLFLLPVNLFQVIINNLSSQLCSTINLGNLYGTDLNLPCIDIKSKIGVWIYNIIDYLCCFLLILNTGRLFFKIYDTMTSLNEGNILGGVL